MTREEALKEIKEEFNEFLKGTGLDNEKYLKSEMETNEDLKKVVEANRMAIKALEQEHIRSAEITQYRYDCEKLMEENERLKKALEQEPILDKIRAEIEQLRLHKAQFLTSDNKVCIDSQEVLNIIDKYKDNCDENTFCNRYQKSKMQAHEVNYEETMQEYKVYFKTIEHLTNIKTKLDYEESEARCYPNWEYAKGLNRAKTIIEEYIEALRSR